MATPKFAFDLHRATPLGPVELAPVDLNATIVQRLPNRIGNSLLLLARDVALDYEIGVWDETTNTGTWVVIATGSLVAGSPVVIPFPFAGEELNFYIRRTNVTIADGVFLVKVVDATVTPLPVVPLATETTLAAVLAKLIVAPATAALQTAANAILGNLQGASIPPTATGVVTASDVTTYDPPLRFLTATGAGDIALALSGSTNTITLTVSANERITSLLISQVLSTGTTATGISGAA